MYPVFENLLAKVNIEEFVPILIFAAVIVVNVVKAIAQRKENKESKQPLRQNKTGRYLSSENDFKTMEQLREERIEQIRKTFGITTPQRERKLVTPPPAPRSIPKPVVHRPVIQKPVQQHIVQPQKVYTQSNARIENPQMRIDANAAVARPANKVHHKKMAEKPAMILEEITTETADSRDMLFSSPQDLRKAILYQEILGKPLSLREAY